MNGSIQVAPGRSPGSEAPAVETHAGSLATAERIGAGIVFLTAAAYLCASLVLVAGGSLAGPWALGIVTASAFGCLAAGRKAWGDDVYVVAAAVAATWVAAALAAAFVIDVSWDGQTYHQEAVVALAKGWNPYRGCYGGDFVFGGKYGPDATPMSLWACHYANASWMLQALAAGVSGILEVGKSVGVALLLASMLVTMGTLSLMGLGSRWSVVVGILAGLNPVALVQLPTHYVDGTCASLLLILANVLVLSVTGRCGAGRMALGAASVLVLVNLKFTMIPMVGVLCAAAALCHFVRSGLRRACVRVTPLALAGVMGIFVTGYAPYVSNTLEHGHPFYPAMGAGKVDFMTWNTPSGITALPWILRAAASHASATANPGVDGGPALKVPFTLSISEIGFSGLPDPRIGGMGPLFSGAFLIASALLAWMRISGKLEGKAWTGFLVFSASLLASVAINPEAWWARYVPQLWLLPVSVAAMAFAFGDRTARWGAVGLGMALAANAGICASAAGYINYVQSRGILAQEAQILARRTTSEAYFGSFTGTFVRLSRLGIDVTPLRSKESLSCPAPFILAGTHGESLMCLARGNAVP